MKSKNKTLKNLHITVFTLNTRLSTVPYLNVGLLTGSPNIGLRLHDSSKSSILPLHTFIKIILCYAEFIFLAHVFRTGHTNSMHGLLMVLKFTVEQGAIMKILGESWTTKLNTFGKKIIIATQYALNMTSKGKNYIYFILLPKITCQILRPGRFLTCPATFFICPRHAGLVFVAQC